MRRWEYLELRVHGAHDYWSDSLGRSGRLSSETGARGGTTAMWNDLGDQGWELVGITSGDPPNHSYLAVFKRPKPDRHFAGTQNGSVAASGILRREAD